MIFKLFNTNLKDMTLKTKKKKGGGQRVMSLILQGLYLRGKKSSVRTFVEEIVFFSQSLGNRISFHIFLKNLSLIHLAMTITHSCTKMLAHLGVVACYGASTI